MHQTRVQTVILLLILLTSGRLTNAATSVSGTLTGTPHWTIAGAPYRLTGNVTVAAGATLTVDPGVRAEATGDYTLTILGTLQVSASAANPAVFTTTSPDHGTWRGVYFAPGSVANVTGAWFSRAVDNVTVDAAQVSCAACSFLGASRDGAVVYNQAQFSATNCTFANNGRRGLYVETVYPQGSVTGSSFTNNGEYPLYLKANCVGMLGSGLTFRNNGHQQIAVSPSAATDLQQSQTWRSQPIPLDLTVGSSDALTVPAGVTLTLLPPLTLIASRIQVAGRLLSGRAGSAWVNLMGPSKTPGSWEGVYLSAGAEAQFIRTRAHHAVTAVTADGARLIARNSDFYLNQFDGLNVSAAPWLMVDGCSVRRNGRYGLRLASSSAGNILRTQFLGNGNYPVYTEARAAALLGGSNWYWTNARQSIGVACGAPANLTGSATWKNQGIPYDVTARPADPTLVIPTGATLTLSAGVALLGGVVEVRGNLVANGLPNQPVSFLPAAGDSPGSWTGLLFQPGAGGKLINCVVACAETGVALSSASPLLRGCTLQRCRYAAVDCQGAAAPIIQGCLVADNEGDGIRTADTAQPNLGNVNNGDATDDGGNAFRNNGGYDVRNCSSARVFAQNNWWGTADPAAIRARILDGYITPGYGVVAISPFLDLAGRPAPVLDWTGETGYVSSGVAPTSGAPQQWYEFRVKYTSSAGREPRYVRLHLSAGDSPYPGSPFALSRLAGTDAASGYIYGVSLRLAAGRDYSYFFAAADALLPASGTPAERQSGPVVNTAPTLAWTGEPGYVSGGVSPTSGVAGASYFFRIKYTDVNSDDPTSVLLFLERDGTPVTGSPFALAWESGLMGTGAIYKRALVLSAGRYRYRFVADDGLAGATGPPISWQTGPEVGAGASLRLGVIAAAETGAGQVSLRCQLSQPADVTIRVHNLAGRPVATPVVGLVCEAGERLLVWNRRSDRGVLLPGGVYLLEITARAPSGEQARQVLAVSLR